MQEQQDLKQHLEGAAKISDVLKARTQQDPNGAAYSFRVEFSEEQFRAEQRQEWQTVTNQECLQHIERVAEYLKRLGAQEGERVAILSNTRPEWLEAEFAIYESGASLVTAYTADSAERNGYVLFDSGVQIVFVENEEQAEKLLKVTREDFELPKSEMHGAGTARLQLQKIICFEPLSDDFFKRNNIRRFSPGEHYEPGDEAFLFEQFDAARDCGGIGCDSGKSSSPYGINSSFRHTNNDTCSDQSLRTSSHSHSTAVHFESPEASVIYTSGTTGAPKGVSATHRQHLENIIDIFQAGLIQGEQDIFHLLPQAHAFGLRMVHLGLLGTGKALFPRISNSKSSALDDEARQKLMEDFSAANAHIIPAVPKLLERIREGILEKVEKAGGLKAKIFKLVLASLEREFAYRHMDGPRPTLGQRALSWLLKSPLTGHISDKICRGLKVKLVGNNFQYFISGGAALPNEVAKFFWALGMPIYEGYGATETNVPVTVNTPKKFKIGSVGPRLSDKIELEIAEDGEVLVRAPNIASGYINAPEATAKTWEKDGTYHSRDQGRFDGEFLFLGGRVDDVIVPSHGENIQLAPLEARLKRIPFVSEGIVVGHKRPSLLAVLSVPEAALRSELNKAHPGYKPAEDIYSDPAAIQLAQQAIQKHYNPSVKSFERIKHVVLVPEFTVGDGYTAKMSVQRNVVIKKYQEKIDALYRQEQIEKEKRKRAA